MKKVNSFLGVNLEDLSLRHNRDDHEELECQRVLLHKTLLNSVLGVNLEDLSPAPTVTTMRNWNVNVLLHKPVQ